MDDKQILLHTCCAPCAGAPLERLLESGYSPAVYYANSNIYPHEEFLKRESCVRELCRIFAVPFISEPWRHDKWLDAVDHRSNDQEGGHRCQLCFSYNLGLASKQAERAGMSQFTTTLAVSPRKSFSQLAQAGAAYQSFVPIDFKKQGGYQRSIELSRNYGFYRQHYCGCEFSLRKPPAI